MSAFVIAISGPSGAGKTTLVRRVATELANAATLFYDDYAEVAAWHPDIRRWVEEGCDPDTWVSIPQLATDLRALHEDRPSDLTPVARPAAGVSYVVLEEPWGRDRSEVAPWIDFVAHIAIPLDISLCRKLLREYAVPSADRDPLELVREYLSLRLGEVYRRQLQVGERADLVVDGLRPTDEITVEIVDAVRQAAHR